MTDDDDDATCKQQSQYASEQTNQQTPTHSLTPLAHTSCACLRVCCSAMFFSLCRRFFASSRHKQPAAQSCDFLHTASGEWFINARLRIL
jgi:hypothetical protein